MNKQINTKMLVAAPKLQQFIKKYEGPEFCRLAPDTINIRGIEGKLNIGNITLNLIDTAGIRESDDFVENIGIKKAKEVLEKAQLVLLVLDNNDITNYDLELLEITKNKNRIIRN